MAVNIFKPIKFGKEVFHPKSFDESTFVMDWTVDAGGKVPPHLHQFMDEHFLITKGEIIFKVNGEKVIKKAGEEIFVPKGIVHSVTNGFKGTSGMTVTYTPCSDTHRMFEIIATLDEKNPGSMMNMAKYFYLCPRLGLKAFSTPQPLFVNSILNTIASIMGLFGGWNKLIEQFKDKQL